MKFPLPTGTFPDVLVTVKDRMAFTALVQDALQEALLLRQEFHGKHKGMVDRQIWKRLKQHKDVSVYKQVAGDSASCASETTGSIGGSRLPAMLMVGSMPGLLDDVMYGISANSANAMRIKATYVNDQYVDCLVLAELTKPSLEDPFRSLLLKWIAKDSSGLAKPFVRPRDVVYLEFTGVMTTGAGERIGYQVHRSVEVAGVRELTELGIVRAHSANCALFRQATKSTVEVFVTSSVDPLGKLSSSYAESVLATTLLSVCDLTYCADMRKLTWLIKTSAQVAPMGDDKDKDERCTECKKSMSSFSLNSKKNCRSCSQRVCSSCCETKRLSFISCRSGNVVYHNVTFCKSCVLMAAQTSASGVAMYENVNHDKHFVNTDMLDSQEIVPDANIDYPSTNLGDFVDHMSGITVLNNDMLERRESDTTSGGSSRRNPNV